MCDDGKSFNDKQPWHCVLQLWSVCLPEEGCELPVLDFRSIVAMTKFHDDTGRKAERKTQADESLLKRPPTDDESLLVYNLFQQQIDAKYG